MIIATPVSAFCFCVCCFTLSLSLFDKVHEFIKMESSVTFDAAVTVRLDVYLL